MLIWIIKTLPTPRNCLRCGKRQVLHLDRRKPLPEVSCTRDAVPHAVALDSACFLEEQQEWRS